MVSTYEGSIERAYADDDYADHPVGEQKRGVELQLSGLGVRRTAINHQILTSIRMGATAETAFRAAERS